MKTKYLPRLPSIKKPMTKNEFVIEYVLRRAIIRPDSLSGVEAAKEAFRAWEIIQKG